MKKILYITFSILFITFSCTKEDVLNTEINSKKSNSLIDINQTIETISNKILTFENGILHLQNIEQLHNIIDIIDESTRNYHELIANKLEENDYQDIPYDELYIEKLFAKNNLGMKSLLLSPKSTLENGGFLTELPSSISVLLSEFGEIKIGNDYFRIYKNGEYLSLNNPSLSDIELERSKIRVNNERSSNTCISNKTVTDTYSNGYCAFSNRYYKTDISLRILNINYLNIHKIIWQINSYSRSYYSYNWIPTIAKKLSITIDGYFWETKCKQTNKTNFSTYTYSQNNVVGLKYSFLNTETILIDGLDYDCVEGTFETRTNCPNNIQGGQLQICN